MLRVKVDDGGTKAGRKTPLREPRPEWQCECGQNNKGYHTRCLRSGCNRRRD